VSDIEVQLDDLQEALSEVDVLAVLTGEAFGDVDWTAPDSANVEAMATLLRLIGRSSFNATSAYHRLRRVVSDLATGEQGEAGGQVVMPAEDAAIVRRIRSNSPDGRYNGGSDAELIELFKRNKRVLARSDEDVIAVMTRSR
jgi:hypothetical protein